jgi:hypothetical protein
MRDAARTVQWRNHSLRPTPCATAASFASSVECGSWCMELSDVAVVPLLQDCPALVSLNLECGS